MAFYEIIWSTHISVFYVTQVTYQNNSLI